MTVAGDPFGDPNGQGADEERADEYHLDVVGEGDGLAVVVHASGGAAVTDHVQMLQAAARRCGVVLDVVWASPPR